MLHLASCMLLLFFVTNSPLASLADPSNVTATTTSLLTPGLYIIPCLEPSAIPCARALIPAFLDSDSASLLLSLATSAFALSPGASGPVTIVDLVSGALSYQERFVNVFALLKQKDAFFPLAALALYVELTQRVKAIISDALNVTAPLYLTRPSFFAQIDADKPPVTTNDEYYHAHVDEEQYGSFHFTALLYLKDWADDFTGGEFVFQDADDGAQQRRPRNSAELPVMQDEASVAELTTDMPEEGGVGAREYEVRPSRGALLYFTSGAENTHFVRRVVSGRRSTLTIAFTKDETDSVEAILDDEVRAPHRGVAAAAVGRGGYWLDAAPYMIRSSILVTFSSCRARPRTWRYVRTMAFPPVPLVRCRSVAVYRRRVVRGRFALGGCGAVHAHSELACLAEASLDASPTLLLHLEPSSPPTARPHLRPSTALSRSPPHSSPPSPPVPSFLFSLYSRTCAPAGSTATMNARNARRHERPV